MGRAVSIFLVDLRSGETQNWGPLVFVNLDGKKKTNTQAVRTLPTSMRNWRHIRSNSRESPLPEGECDIFMKNKDWHG
eukprot:1147809-Pelagomonas_calceolata.AAC.8